MKRRDFLKKAGLTAGAVFAAPYILPSGRLFAQTGARIANHVVVCLYAGGVRNLESIQKMDGNLMPNVLNGTEPISPDILPGMSPLPGGPLSTPLQNYGTLYKNFRFAYGPTGHYAAHTVAMTGHYTDTSLNIKEPPEFPTIFELYRKHSSPSASSLNAWWVSNALGPYPALNYSKYPGYGSLYGANFVQPSSLISARGFNALGDIRSFSAGEETSLSEIRSFLDKNFRASGAVEAAGVENGTSEATALRNFIAQSLNDAAAGLYNDPWGVGAAQNGDMFNIFYAEEIIKEFQPELLVVNMQDVDVCHFEYTAYANNLRKADFAVAHLWDTIQSTPGMANDTILIVVPEHGRNQQPNTLIDAYGRYAIDHTAIDQSGDQMSREIFCLVCGPPNVVRQGQEINQVVGESIDLVPTIAKVLGFDTDIPASVIPPGSYLGDAFV